MTPGESTGASSDFADTLDSFDLPGKSVLVRVDLNVPMRDGTVSDDTRIRRARTTVRELLDKGAHPILISHFGRPKSTDEISCSLERLVPSLEEAFGARVRFVGTSAGTDLTSRIGMMPPGEITLLENLRFNPGESSNCSSFASELAATAHIYCNDAFSASHRKHASIVAIANLLPSCMGRLFQQEVTAIHAAVSQPSRPLVSIVGGAKISTKISLLESLLARSDCLVVGGAMANTFLLANGNRIGRSRAEPSMIETAREVLRKGESVGCRVVLPTDVVVAQKLQQDSAPRSLNVEDCPDDLMILDIGPGSVATIRGILEGCKTLFWNGPFGAFECPPFDAATIALANVAASLTRSERIKSFAGGGDTAAALACAGVVDDFSYVSAAGGAFLEAIEGSDLPGMAALRKSRQARRENR